LVDRWMSIYMYMYTSQLRCVSWPEINYTYKWHPFLRQNSHYRYDFLYLFCSLVSTLSPPVYAVSIYPQWVVAIQMLGEWDSQNLHAINNINKISQEDGDGSAMS
jgi:hypothetical protein